MVAMHGSPHTRMSIALSVSARWMEFNSEVNLRRLLQVMCSGAVGIDGGVAEMQA